MFQSIIKGIWNGFLNITGTRVFLTLFGNKWDWNRVLAIALILCLILSVVWMIRLFPKYAAGAGKAGGGLLWGLLKLGVAFGVAIGIAHMILGMGMAMVAGALGRIPLIGTFLANVTNWLIQAVAGLVIAIVMGIYLIKNVGSLIGQAISVVTGSVSDWKADDGKGIGGVKPLYVISMCLVLAVIICHPNWNKDLKFIPAGLSGLLGIVAIIWTTATGQAWIDRTVGTVMGKPRESDGAWQCPNHSGKDKRGRPGKGCSNPIPVMNKDGTPKKGANGKLLRGTGRCQGPQGKDEKGKPFDGWNPKEATHCLSLLCDHPSPFWQVCDNPVCKNAKKKTPFPRAKWNEAVRCPVCRKTFPALPETTPFHLPGKDKSNPNTKPKRKQLKGKPKRAQLPATRPPAGLLHAPGQGGTNFCQNCGQGLLPGTKFCINCATPIAQPGPFAPSPAVPPFAPSPFVPAPTATPMVAPPPAVVPASPAAPQQPARRRGYRSLRDKWN